MYKVRSLLGGGGIVYVSRSASLREAAIRMINEGVGALIVVDEHENPIGIITKRDIIYAFIVYSEAPKREIGELSSIRVEEFMSKPLITIDADEDIRTAVALMRKYNISHLPVVEGRKLIGIITDADISDLVDELLEIIEHRESQ